MTNENFYIISTNATIKSTPTNLDKAFKKDLVTDNGDLKPYVEKIIDNVFYYGKQCINATIPTLFIEIEYKDSNKDIFLISHEVFLYSEDMSTLKDLENYKSKFNFNFGSQVEKEVYEIVEAFHLGHGCMCLSSEGY
jgi:asparagine N-glycosylation enzyme membrane subunit Stt3